MANWTGLLGLASRARKLISGEEFVISNIRNGQAYLVLIASDASENTMKKITDKCGSYNVPYRVVEDRYILGATIGKDARVVVAVTDRGFAKKLQTFFE